MLRDSMLGPVPENAKASELKGQPSGLVHQANDDLSIVERNIVDAIEALSAIEKAMS